MQYLHHHVLMLRQCNFPGLQLTNAKGQVSKIGVFRANHLACEPNLSLQCISAKAKPKDRLQHRKQGKTLADIGFAASQSLPLVPEQSHSHLHAYNNQPR